MADESTMNGAGSGLTMYGAPSGLRDFGAEQQVPAAQTTQTSNTTPGNKISGKDQYFEEAETQTPRNTPEMNAENMRIRVNEGYGPDEQQELIKRVGDTGQAQIKSARSREQQKANYPYQFTNLAKNNPRGNLNRATFNDTLRYSRLADRLNNRMHWDPGTGMVATGLRGMTKAPTSPTVSRWEPITTQEMRQMRANERLDESARQAGIDLQSRIQAYPQDLQEIKDKAVLNITDAIQRATDSTNRFWQQLVMSTEYKGNWDLMFKELWQKFLDQHSLYIDNRVLSYLLSIENPIEARMAGQVIHGGGVVTPERIQYLVEQIIDQAIENNPDWTKEQVAMFANTIEQFFYMTSTVQDYNSMLRGILPWGK